MSFILQIFRGPAVKTVQEAVAHIDSNPPASWGEQKRFAEFVDEVTRTYPNPGDDDDDSAWPEGLAAEGHVDAVYNFAVNLDWLDENLMAHVGHAAAKAGLKVLDPQNGLLYPVDGQVVDMSGASNPLPAPRPVKPPPPKGLPPGFDDEKEVGAKLASQLAAVLAPYGFKVEASGLVVRQMGRVKQALDVGTMKRDRDMTLFLRLSFVVPEIAVLWKELLGAPVAAYFEHRKTIPRYASDFRLYASELRRPASEAARRVGAHAYEETHNWDEAHAWLRQVVGWLKAEGLADLDRMRDPAGLAEFVLNETQLERMFRRNELLPDELFARLILMGAFAPERREDWLRGFWDHYDRSGLRFESGSVMSNFKELAGKTIAWLETDEFAHVADQLRVRA